MFPILRLQYVPSFGRALDLRSKTFQATKMVFKMACLIRWIQGFLQTYGLPMFPDCFLMLGNSTEQVLDGKQLE